MAVLLLLSGLWTGCGTADPADDGGLKALAGVADAEIRDVEIEESVFEQRLVVDAEPDATVEQITEILLAMGETSAGEALLHLGAGDVGPARHLSDGSHAQIEGACVRRGPMERAASLLRAGADAFPDQFVRIDALGCPDEPWIHVETDSTDPERVNDLVDTFRADETLSAAQRTSLSAYEVRSGGGQSLVAALNTDNGIDPATEQAWKSLSTTMSLSSLEIESLSLQVRDGIGTIDSSIARDAEVASAQFTTEAYGDSLWPMLHAQLDVLKDLPDGSVLWLRNDGDFPVNLTKGEVPPPDQHGQTWNKDAAEYLTES